MGALERVPGKQNWVDYAGGLPRYIERIAVHLHRKGKSIGHSIAIAVNACKKMCSTGDLNWPGLQQVNLGSKAQACAAIAQWDAKRKSGAGRKGKKLAQEHIKAHIIDLGSASHAPVVTEEFDPFCPLCIDLAWEEIKGEVIDLSTDVKKMAITDEASARKAISACQSAEDPENCRRWVVKQLKSKNMSHLIPSHWNPDGTMGKDGKSSGKAAPFGGKQAMPFGKKSSDGASSGKPPWLK